jgi:hypothetical protein
LGIQTSWYRDNEQSVQRLVVDECHQAVTCAIYRKKFISVKELAQYLVQKIYLSATMPLHLDDYFLVVSRETLYITQGNEYE